MGAHVVGIYNGTEFTKAVPWIWDGSKWLLARPYVYNSGWKAIGGEGTLYIELKDKNGNQLLLSNNDIIQVPMS